MRGLIEIGVLGMLALGPLVPVFALAGNQDESAGTTTERTQRADARSGAADRSHRAQETLEQAILRQTDGLRPHVLEMALSAYQEAERGGHLRRERLTIIDYELPSPQKRLWVVDIPARRVLHEEWVSHGMGAPRGSGGTLTRTLAFANQGDSLKSVLGGLITAETYYGKNGYSLRLDGLEPGYNDQARTRAVVMHGADYVSAERAASGTMGRSWGCPAVSRAVERQLIDDIKEGSLIWGYYPDQGWLSASHLLAGRSAG